LAKKSGTKKRLVVTVKSDNRRTPKAPISPRRILMFVKKSLIFLLLGVILLAACAPQALPQTGPTATDPAATAPVPVQPVTLRMALADQVGRPSEPYVLEFIQQVKTRSNGSITIESVWDAGAETTPPFEQGVVKMVTEGQYDLGLAGSRAWDTMGVISFQALQAPFLITNDELAIAVATSDIGKQMLDALSASGVIGLALWPEDLRHPFSLVPGKSILSPQDFEGANVRVIGSNVTYLLIETLGGKPAVEADDFQAAESGLRQGASLPGTPTGTGNVIFFPKYQVLVANGAAFEALSQSQQGIIRDAAAATQEKAIAEHPSDVENGAAWCKDGGTIVLASEAQIAAFEKATQPVFDSIEKDLVNKEHIAAIRDLKAKTPPSPGATACGPADTAEVWSPGLPPNGVWRVELSVDDLVQMGLTASMAEKEWAGVYTWTYQGGKGEFYFKSSYDGYEINCQADLAVVDDFVRATYTSGSDCDNEIDDFQWRLEADGLHLHMIAIQNAPFLQNKAYYEAKPWQAFKP
jgi:TRAP-type C4-dicarboxylate transport system substrate-binding protein